MYIFTLFPFCLYFTITSEFYREIAQQKIGTVLLQEEHINLQENSSRNNRLH
jgi:hypothetical protein